MLYIKWTHFMENHACNHILFPLHLIFKKSFKHHSGCYFKQAKKLLDMFKAKRKYLKKMRPEQFLVSNETTCILL